MTVVWFLIVISVLVFVHEFGHFIVAKRGGIRVIEFAFGFGPRLIKFQRGETLYSVRLLPIGGFCRFMSEHELNADLEEGVITREEYEELLPRSFERKSYARRMGVITGGPVFNFVLGAVLFVLLFAVWGIPKGTGSNVISDVVPDHPAAQAGMEAGDRILAINDQSIPDWDALLEVIGASRDQPLLIEVQKPDGSVRRVLVTPRFNSETGRTIIGISNEYVYEKVSPWEAVKLGVRQTVEFTRLLVVALLGLFTDSQSREELGGVFSLAEEIGKGAKQGVSTLWGLTAVLSIQFGVLNLFPFPALDGGQVVFMTYERIRGREMKPELKGFINLAGIALLILFMVWLMYKDIMRIFFQG